jgi:anthranilate synthase component 2
MRVESQMNTVVLIDNYDSFTFNLAHYLGSLGATVKVLRNDAATVGEIMQMRPAAIVLSPGPCTPSEAGVCLDLIKAAAAVTPVLGVCLGHQAIGQAFGGKVVRGLFRGINGAFMATRYHSLIVDRETAPSTLQIDAETDDGLIMGLSHRALPLHGVQFHPESILSEHGHLILRNFLEIAQIFNHAAA